LTVAACLGFVACYRLLYGDSHRGSFNFFLAFGLWLGAVLFSLIGSPDAEGSLDLLGVVPEFLVAWSVFLLIADAARFRWALYGVACTTVFFSTLTLIQAVFGLHGNDLWGFAQGGIQQVSLGVNDWRPTGPISDPNFYAQLLLPGLAICIDRTLHGSVWATRTSAALGMVVISAALILTGSRGALVASVAMVVVFLYRERRMLKFLPVVLIAPVVAVFLVPALGDRMDAGLRSVASLEVGTAGHLDTAVVGRFNELMAAQYMYREHPWTGVGYGQFERHYQPVSARYDLMMRPADRGAHSLYLETLAEQGLLGIVVLAAILAMAARAIIRARIHLPAAETNSRNLVAALGVGLVGFFLASVFLHDAYPRYQWVMLALAFAAEKAALASQRAESDFNQAGVLHART
jgi:putative inorganic carbon (hco3(-)) transporter